jgi:hypothetical protein
MDSPLKLVILMLGTNDFQCTHDNNAWLSAQGTAELIDSIRQAPIEPGMPQPEIMVISPPKIVNPKGVIANKFQGSEKRCVGLNVELKKIKPEFIVSKHDEKYWIEIIDETGFCVSHAGLMGFSLSQESSSKEDAQKIADFLNNNIDAILFTPF